jgi:uncharacterized protein (UPF0332 family)
MPERDNLNHLQWCLSKDNGIRIVAPSEQLVRAYREKSKTALKSMEVNRREGIAEWAISTSYYAKYFIVYALFAKLGVKSEIHSCTIALFEYLVGDDLPANLVHNFRRSKEDRVETQYYPLNEEVDLDSVATETTAFALEIEKLLDSLNSKRIAQLQHKLHDL